MKHPDTGEELTPVQWDQTTHGMVQLAQGQPLLRTHGQVLYLWIPDRAIANGLAQKARWQALASGVQPQPQIAPTDEEEPSRNRRPIRPEDLQRKIDFYDGAREMREAIRTAAYDAVAKGDPPLSSFRIGEVPLPKPEGSR